MFHHCNRWYPRYAYAHEGYRSSLSPGRYESRRRRGGHNSHSGFGVRRPLRYLSYQLDLDDAQVRHIAAVLDRLKTEREQAALDESRTVTDIAGLVTQADLSVDKLKEALAPRVASAERLQQAVAKAVQEIVAELDAEQREDFAYLLNSKALNL